MKQQLTHLIYQLQQHINTDLADGTHIPERYQKIQELLDQAKTSLKEWDLDTTLDLIGEINLDTLQEVDELDDTIGDLIHQLKQLQHSYLTAWVAPHQQVQQELVRLKKVLERHHHVSQTCP